MKLIHRRDLRAALGIASETMRVWQRDKKLPPPDVNVSKHSQWWRPDTLAAAGFKLAAPPAAAESGPPPAA